MLEAKQEYGDTTNYVGELKKLEERGYSNPTEITQAAAKEDENLKKYEAAACSSRATGTTYFPP